MPLEAKVWPPEAARTDGQPPIRRRVLCLCVLRDLCDLCVFFHTNSEALYTDGLHCIAPVIRVGHGGAGGAVQSATSARAHVCAYVCA